MVWKYFYSSSVFVYYQYIFDNVYGICIVKAEIQAEKTDYEDCAGVEYVPCVYEYDRRILYLKGHESDTESCSSCTCLFGRVGFNLLCV